MKIAPILFVLFLLFSPFSLPAYDDFLQCNNRTIPSTDIFRTTLFETSGTTIHTFCKPTVVVTKDSLILAFAEARKISWQDNTPTDIVMKRSSDQGLTWSEIIWITQSENEVYSNPCPVVDHVTGEVFLFTLHGSSTSESTAKASKRALLFSSLDGGYTWERGKDMTDDITSGEAKIGGFGSGAGIQIQGEMFAGRLVIPISQIEEKEQNRILYSDNHGETWLLGSAMLDNGRFHVVESPRGILQYHSSKQDNLRGDHRVAKSFDGGESWCSSFSETMLPSSPWIGSLAADDKILFSSGLSDTRSSLEAGIYANLRIYRSLTAGAGWHNSYTLQDQVAGHSSLALFPGKQLGVIFEAVDTNSFSDKNDRNQGGQRIDLVILPTKVFRRNYWFENML